MGEISVVKNTLKRRLERSKLVHHGAEGPHIAGAIVLLAGPHLRQGTGRIGQSADQRALRCRALLDPCVDKVGGGFHLRGHVVRSANLSLHQVIALGELRHIQVPKLGGPVCREKHVRRFHIAVGYVLGVEVGEPLGHLNHVRPNGPLVDAPPHSLTLLDAPGEVSPFAELHNKAEFAAVLCEICSLEKHENSGGVGEGNENVADPSSISPARRCGKQGLGPTQDIMLTGW